MFDLSNDEILLLWAAFFSVFAGIVFMAYRWGQSSAVNEIKQIEQNMLNYMSGRTLEVQTIYDKLNGHTLRLDTQFTALQQLVADHKGFMALKDALIANINACKQLEKDLAETQAETAKLWAMETNSEGFAPLKEMVDTHTQDLQAFNDWVKKLQDQVEALEQRTSQ